MMCLHRLSAAKLPPRLAIRSTGICKLARTCACLALRHCEERMRRSNPDLTPNVLDRFAIARDDVASILPAFGHSAQYPTTILKNRCHLTGGGPSGNCGISSVMTNHGALLSTWTWSSGRSPGSSSNGPSGTQTYETPSNFETTGEPQTLQKPR